MDFYTKALIAIIVVWYLVAYIRWWKKVYRPMSKMPGMTRVPILGTTYKIIGVPREKLFNHLLGHVKEYEPLFCTWLGSTPEVHIVKAEYLEIVMNNSVHITKGNQYDYLVPWLGQGLLTSKGTKWLQHRKFITPAFHFKILENFMDTFVNKTRILLDNLDSKSAGETFDIYQDITLCALDIICETAMGVPVNAMSSKNKHYVEAIYGISEIIGWRMFRPYITDFIFQFLPVARVFRKHLSVLHGFTDRVIAERKQLRYKTKRDLNLSKVYKKKHLSFLDLLLQYSEDGASLTDRELREEVDTFMFEGHDTTATAICWSLLLLGNHPEIQEKVFEEVREILQTKPIPTSLMELHEFKYLECVIREGLRLYPSVPFISRTLQQEITIDKYKIPAGVHAILHIYAVHRSPEYYQDPDKFIPDRFLPENSRDRHPYAYIPFSAGPRNCIGQKFAMYEEKTVLASIINRFKVTTLESVQEVTATSDLILRPLNGVFIKLDKR